MKDVVEWTPRKALAQFPDIKRALDKAKDPETLVDIDATLERIEGVMREAGIPFDRQQEVNEVRVVAWSKIGGAVKPLMPGPGGKPDRGAMPNRRALLERIPRQRFTDFVRVHAMPLADLITEAARYWARHQIVHLHDAVSIARPFWNKERRATRHEAIREKAKAQKIEGKLGPFALIYADPPWVFETFAPSGRESNRAADEHYPTLPDDEIRAIRFGGLTVDEIAHKNAALFLWCTSSNLIRALSIMDAWGFVYKTHLVWDKEKIGLGYVFRNQHELLLYGDRGKFVKPEFVPPSVYRQARAVHSAKPLAIRKHLEKMYPAFDAATRCELFARGKIDGWTGLGFEA